MSDIYTYSFRLPFIFKGKDFYLNFSLDSLNSESELQVSEIKEAIFRLMSRVSDMELTEDLITFDGELTFWLPANQIRELLVHRVDYLVGNDLIFSYLQKIDSIESDDSNMQP